MKTGIRVNSGVNEHGLKQYKKVTETSTVYTWALNIKDARLHFKTGTNVFYRT